MTDDGSGYFFKDTHYSDVLKTRLKDGVEMDSARAMAGYLQSNCSGDLRILDFGGGPGHYFPVIARTYTGGRLAYHSVDIDETHVQFGQDHFHGHDGVSFAVGSVLEPGASHTNQNCIISANTLPHVQSVQPLLHYVRDNASIEYVVFRMLIGNECVQIKKHLLEDQFDAMYASDFQYNNIYTLKYLQWCLGPDWQLDIKDDVFDAERLQQHRLPAQDSDPFYANRVSRPVGQMIFKGDIYMPWRFVIGRRNKHP